MSSTAISVDIYDMTIGSQLKKARQKKQVTLEEVHKKTKIHPNVLTALEEERFDQILNTTYIRSFLREYASYLGLDGKKILEEYNTSFPKEKQQAPAYLTPLTKRRVFVRSFDKGRFLKNIRKLGIFLLAVILTIFLVKGTTSVFKRVSREISLQLKESQQLKGSQKTKAAPKPVLVKRKAGAKIKLPEKKKELSMQTSIGKPKDQLKQKLVVPVGDKLTLTITAKDNVWLELKVDGKLIFKDILKKGSSEKWIAKDNFRIWTGKAEAMQLNLNGTDIGMVGEGIRKDIIITREGVKNR